MGWAEPLAAGAGASGRGGATDHEGNPMRKTMLAVAVFCLVGVAGAAAQEFPSRAVSLMMPYAAGGPGDTITRVIANGMGKVFGRQFVVENTAGAGGTIGTA